MPNVLIRELPPEVHAVLVRRAEAAGQSLQQYLVTVLERLTNTPTLDEVFDRLETGGGSRRGQRGRIGFESAVASLREGRVDRDRR